MVRKIIEIDRDKCNGCGLCARACHEGAICMVDGKAELRREDYCDGLGDCLPACPTGAITFVEREAAEYNHQGVMEHQKKYRVKGWQENNAIDQGSEFQEERSFSGSRLMQWPVQIKLAPVKAPYFDGARLLIGADCAAYACGNFHERFMKGHITLIGCPKLDAVDYSEKLAEMIRENQVAGITVARMAVPCCRGLELAVERAVQRSGKKIPIRAVVIGTGGEILSAE